MEDRNKMKLILKLAEKPRNKDFRFSKLTVKGVDTFGRDIFLEFSKDEFNHFNMLSSFNEEQNVIIIDNATITVIGQNKKYDKCRHVLSDKDKVIREILASDNSVLTVFEENWFDLRAEFEDLY